ncbi:ATP-dependent dethiobiotin synthetase BioD [Leuconostoc litchii]|uniref:ATP-dependent dethiobiotin synthetase BioD n=1 Tax=Leuconostoc litchii TaxID=1981069 RepID=A0A6P2CNF8_9LACO|nr:dethiobiotin synthase [Leuconostoc litchii]TYC47595.1 dethiobiotin synthase [Leuconostoc litchii]GMA69636.1 ATP-dependent dethiobiotin synthetase BioD [Leuconostoc litchii]
MKNKGYFITGTDTEIGKTFVTAVLASYFNKHNQDIGVFKPLMSGARREDTSSDAYILKDSANVKDSLEEINPFQWDEALAPALAQKRAKTNYTLDDVLKKYNILAQKHNGMLVEGAGGITVPYGDNFTVTDLARELKLPLIIVAPNKLGVINHIILTIEFARNHHLKIAGIIFNGAKHRGTVEDTNLALLKEMTNVPIIGELPWINHQSPTAILLEKYLNLKPVM